MFNVSMNIICTPLAQLRCIRATIACSKPNSMRIARQYKAKEWSVSRKECIRREHLFIQQWRQCVFKDGIIVHPTMASETHKPKDPKTAQTPNSTNNHHHQHTTQNPSPHSQTQTTFTSASLAFPNSAVQASTTAPHNDQNPPVTYAKPPSRRRPRIAISRYNRAGV